MKKKGKVYLIGAGPGDPGLLTLRGAEILSQADVVIYDRLVHPSLLDLATQAEKIYRGKRRKESCFQDSINHLMAKKALQGKRVARLKGGDPLVFGRGGEEADFLKKKKIAFEVVPGVSAGYGVPAYAGIPVTDRRLASTVTFATAHESSKEQSQLNWKKLAAIEGTLVFFMGVKTLPKIVRCLIKEGKSLKTAVSVIERGTLNQQRVISGQLGNIISKIKKQKIDSPALTVIGEVNRLRKRLNWFNPKKNKKPLEGKTVLVTRASTQASCLKRGLEEKGASVLEYPTIQIQPPRSWLPLDRALREIKKFDWVLFTSTNSVEAFFNRLDKIQKDVRALSGLKIAAIGTATQQALSLKGIRPDLLPKKYTSEGLLEVFKKKKLIKGKHFLLPRADIAPAFLPKSLQKQGANVTQVTAYRTTSIKDTVKAKPVYKAVQQGEIDYITFTSSSTVRHFFEQLPSHVKRNLKSRFISIGPVTTQTLKAYGFKAFREAKEHTVAGLIKSFQA